MIGAALLGFLGGGAAFALASRRSKREPTSPTTASPPPPTAGYTPKLVPMPHPDWVPGQKQPAPFTSEEWTAYDPAKEEKAAVYPLVISAFVPRPIALVSSCSKDGVVNLAPYSYFNAMCHNPVTICIGINRSPGRGGGKKDTLMNIEETGEFVVNIMSDWYVEAANHSCGDFDTGVDEMALTGLTPMDSQLVKAPRVKESAVHMECKLRQVVDVTDVNGKPTCAIVIAEVVLFHIHKEVQGRSPTGKLVIDPVKLQPISRLGGTLYGRTTEMFDIGRPVAQKKAVAVTTTPAAAAAAAAATPAATGQSTLQT